jgi:hypothetical protein
MQDREEQSRDPGSARPPEGRRLASVGRLGRLPRMTTEPSSQPAAETLVPAIAAAASWHGALDVSRTRVRNQRRTTNPCHRVLRRSLHGTLLGYASVSHHRPATPAPSRRPGARRLLPGVHRNRQLRPHRPPCPRAGLGRAAPGRHSGRMGNSTGSVAPCGIRSTPSPAWPSVGLGSAASKRRSTPPPRRQARLPCLCRPGRV